MTSNVEQLLEQCQVLRLEAWTISKESPSHSLDRRVFDLYKQANQLESAIQRDKEQSCSTTNALQKP